MNFLKGVLQAVVGGVIVMGLTAFVGWVFGVDDWSQLPPLLTGSLIAGLLMGPYYAILAPKVIPALRGLGGKNDPQAIEAEVQNRLDSAVAERLGPAVEKRLKKIEEEREAEPVLVVAVVNSATWYVGRRLIVHLLLHASQDVQLTSPDNRALRIELDKPHPKGNERIALFWDSGTRVLALHGSTGGIGQSVLFVADETRWPSIIETPGRTKVTELSGKLIHTEGRVRIMGQIELTFPK